MIASMEKLKSETIENMLAAQGVPCAPGRAERLAPGVNALNVEDPLREQLPFDVDPTTYGVARERAR
jgi:hypothetical protein